MSVIDKMREAFDSCTVMAGVEPDFECVYITKNAAKLYLAEIEAENAKLRKVMEDLEESDRMHRTMLRQDIELKANLKAENATLRELVRDMYKAFMHGNCYRWCEFNEPCNYISDGRCQWYDRMLELGIEVSE